MKGKIILTDIDKPVEGMQVVYFPVKGSVRIMNYDEPEQWKDIIDYEGLYQVSNWGRVKSLSREIMNSRCKQTWSIPETILKWSLNHAGYPFIALCKNNKRKPVRINRLVAKYFVANPDNKPEVNHDNGDKWDNYYKNLIWSTRVENVVHAYLNGLANTKMAVQVNKKPVRQLTMKGEFVQSFESISDAVRKTGFNNIKAAAKGVQHTAGGYKWEYV